MGRHTRREWTGDEVVPGDAGAPFPAGPARDSRPKKKHPMIPVPLLPIVALVLAVGVVSYALSTQQISLNFAGSVPKEPSREGQVSQRGTGPDGARADGLVVAFRMVSKTSTGFHFTTTIANRGTRPVARWTMTFRIPEALIVSVRGAAIVRTGAVGSVSSPSGAPALQPGDKVKVSYVAQGTARGPSSCEMNSLPCTRV